MTGAGSRRPSQVPTTSAALRGRRAEPRQKGARGRRRECMRSAAGKLCFLQPWFQTAWQQELRCECLEKGDEMEQRAKVVCPSGKGWRPVVIATVPQHRRVRPSNTGAPLDQGRCGIAVDWAKINDAASGRASGALTVFRGRGGSMVQQPAERRRARRCSMPGPEAAMSGAHWAERTGLRVSSPWRPATPGHARCHARKFTAPPFQNIPVLVLSLDPPRRVRGLLFVEFGRVDVR